MLCQRSDLRKHRHSATRGTPGSPPGPRPAAELEALST